MNHKLILGIAVFLAIVGLAVIGGDKQAQAGLGSHGASCSGCDGECDGSGKDCDGSRGGRLSGRRSRGCNGRKGLSLKSLNLRDLLGGGCDGSDGSDGCDGGKSEGGDSEAVPEAPAAASNGFQRTPVTFRTVIFRR